MMKLTKNTNTKLIGLCISLCFILVLGCSKTIEDKIGERIERECTSNSTCTIAIKDIVDFKWDKLYVFSSAVKLEDINNALGSSYPYYKEFSRIIVFMDKGKIVYHEENASNQEHLEDKDVVFNYSDSLKYSSYNVDNAVFSAKVNSTENGVYYELTPINR